MAATAVFLSLLATVLPAEEPPVAFWQTQNLFDGSDANFPTLLSPSDFASSSTAALYRGNLRADSSENWQTRLWSTPYGNWDKNQTGNTSDGFRTDTFGMMAGFDRKRNSRLRWGWGAGGSWISASGENSSGDKDIDAFKTMLNAQVDVKDWRLSLAAGYGHNTQSTNRHTHNGLFHGNNHADQWGLQTDFCLKFGAGLFEIEPFFGLDCHTLSESPYSEKRISGTGSTRAYAKSTEDSFASRIGIRYRWRQTGHLVVWRPELSAEWLHEFSSDQLFRSSQLDPFPTLYTFPEAEAKRDHLLFSIGLVGNLGTSMDIFAKYATDIAGDYTAHSVMCGTNWKF